MEEVSYEFGALLTVAITGSLLARWLALGTERATYAAAYTSAYHQVLAVLVAAAVALATVTWWCFRDNPKSGELFT
ncbi:Uncharacterised protein [Chlamydia trachomatis]|nr:Uncharacterised protein [Chlamydia trachomatis]